MRALILPDADFLTRERAMLSRLEVGLADEGVRVIHAVPRSVDQGATAVDSPGLFSTAIAYPDAGLPMTELLRAGAFARRLAALIDAEGGGGPTEAKPSTGRVVDVIHCFGQAAVRFGFALARRCGSAVVIEAWSDEALHDADRAIRRGGLTGRVLALAPDNATAKLGASLLGERRIIQASWGVHVPEAHHRKRKAGDPFALVLLASTQPAALRPAALTGLRQALEGIATASKELADMLLFVDAAAARVLPITKWTQELGIQHAVSVIPDVEARRDVLVQADALIVGQTLGEHRTFVLEAMAAEMPVITMNDPLVDAFCEGSGVMIVSGDAPSWTRSVLALAGDPELSRTRGRLQRQFIAANRPAYAYISGVFRAYAMIADARQELAETLAARRGASR